MIYCMSNWDKHANDTCSIFANDFPGHLLVRLETGSYVSGFATIIGENPFHSEDFLPGVIHGTNQVQYLSDP